MLVLSLLWNQTVTLVLSIVNQAVVVILSKQTVQELAHNIFIKSKKNDHHVCKVHFGMKCFSRNILVYYVCLP